MFGGCGMLEGSTGFAAVDQIMAAGGGNVNPMLREQTIETCWRNQQGQHKQRGGVVEQHPRENNMTHHHRSPTAGTFSPTSIGGPATVGRQGATAGGNPLVDEGGGSSDRKRQQQAARGLALTSFINQTAQTFHQQRTASSGSPSTRGGVSRNLFPGDGKKSTGSSGLVATLSPSTTRKHLIKVKVQVHTPTVEAILDLSAQDHMGQRLAKLHGGGKEMGQSQLNEIRQTIQSGTVAALAKMKELMEENARRRYAQVLHIDHPLRCRTCTLQDERNVSKMRASGPSVMVLTDEPTGRTSRHSSEYFWISVLGADELLAMLRQLERHLEETRKKQAASPTVNTQSNFLKVFVDSTLKFLEANRERFFLEGTKEEFVIKGTAAPAVAVPVTTGGGGDPFRLDKEGTAAGAPQDWWPEQSSGHCGSPQPRPRVMSLTSLAAGLGLDTTHDPSDSPGQLTAGNLPFGSQGGAGTAPLLPPAVPKPVLVIPAFLLEPPRIRSGLPVSVANKLKQQNGLQENPGTRLDLEDEVESLTDFFRKLQLHYPSVRSGSATQGQNTNKGIMNSSLGQVAVEVGNSGFGGGGGVRRDQATTGATRRVVAPPARGRGRGPLGRGRGGGPTRGRGRGGGGAFQRRRRCRDSSDDSSDDSSSEDESSSDEEEETSSDTTSSGSSTTDSEDESSSEEEEDSSSEEEDSTPKPRRGAVRGRGSGRR